MDIFDAKAHWEHIYQTKDLRQVSWYQGKPEVSLEYISQFEVPKTAAIIDIGGGDSLFVDHLLDLGYSNITVLDISESALDKAKERLGRRADLVKWVVSDINEFNPSDTYDFWHDRAAFHFLTDDKQVHGYKNLLKHSMNSNGIVVIGAFSEQGPKKCSGIEIRQYSEAKLHSFMEPEFETVDCKEHIHMTPMNNTQHFVFCSFRYK